MRGILALFFTFTAILTSSSPALSENAGNQQFSNQEVELKRIINDIEILRDSIKETRRDQINYKLEKDILKEAYSTNVQTINIIITLILAVFTVIGFVGVKSIGSTKDEFKNELDNLKLIKIKYEEKFLEIGTYLENSKEELKSIKETNEDQNKRLKILEIQEKTGSLISERQFSRALEYISIGLNISDNDIVLLTQKTACLMSLGHFQESINVLRKLIKIDPDNHGHPANIIELSLLTRNIDQYNYYINKYSDFIIENYNSKLIWYYEFIKFYIEGSNQRIKQHIINGVAESETEKIRPLNRWNFAEIKLAFNSDPPSENKKILFDGINYLDGKITGAEFRASIENTKATPK